jgi:hypothetical protein
MSSPSVIPVLSDAYLAARLTRPEDDLCERKSNTDYRGWIEIEWLLRILLLGSVAVLFIGLGDDGTIADNASIPSLMKSYSDGKAERCYPPIDTIQREFIYNGKSCLAVVIPGSEARPHFAGPAFIRDGTQTKKANEEQFAMLISEPIKQSPRDSSVDRQDHNFSDHTSRYVRYVWRQLLPSDCLMQ